MVANQRAKTAGGTTTPPPLNQSASATSLSRTSPGDVSTPALNQPGVLTSKPSKPLEPGEYGLFVVNSNVLSAGGLYDFGVDEKGVLG